MPRALGPVLDEMRTQVERLCEKEAPRRRRIAELLRELSELARANADLQDKLEAAVRARDEFVLAASHDVRTPLAVMQLNLCALERTIGDDPDAAKQIASMDRQIEHLTSLFDRLHEAGRCDGGALPLAIDDVDLGGVAREVARRFSDQLAWSRCPFTLRADEVVGRWDSAQLDQLISNLLANAMKHAAGSPIELVVEDAGAAARLIVRDYGRGISPEERARIFDKFDRGASDHRTPGMGLGLWMVRRIVDAFHGTIELESAVGRGAAFIVTLPKH